MNLERIQLLIQQHRYKDAEKELEKLLAENSDNSRIHGYFAITHLELKKKNKAKEHIQKALSLDPENAYLYYIQSRVFIEDRANYKAENSLKRAIEINPYSSDYYAQLANLYIHRRYYKEAKKTLEKALEIDPENTSALNLYSILLEKKWDIDSAYKMNKKSLNIDPEDVGAMVNMGEIFLKKGKYNLALEHFYEALKKDPEHFKAKQGLLLSIKNKNVVYRFLHRVIMKCFHISLTKMKIAILALAILLGVIFQSFGAWLLVLFGLLFVFFFFLIIPLYLFLDPIYDLILYFTRAEVRVIFNTFQKNILFAFLAWILAMIILIMLYFYFNKDVLYPIYFIGIGGFCYLIILKGIGSKYEKL